MPGKKLYKQAEIENAIVAVDYSGGNVDLPFSTVGLYIGGAGDLVLDAWGEGAGIAFTGLVAGSILPGNFKVVRQTSSTATGVVCLYSITHGS